MSENEWKGTDKQCNKGTYQHRRKSVLISVCDRYEHGKNHEEGIDEQYLAYISGYNLEIHDNTQIRYTRKPAPDKIAKASTDNERYRSYPAGVFPVLHTFTRSHANTGIMTR